MGRVCAVRNEPTPGTWSMTGYIYDAVGNRVAKGTITSMSCDPTANGFTFTENYVLGPSGEELSMFDGGNNWQRTNVYADSKLVGTYDTGGLHFHLEDPLGTRRMQLSGNPNQVGLPETDIQSWPYGDQLYSFPDQYAPATADDATPLHFTGKERDSESGNDYFGARYYASATGRWLSPDWADRAEPVPYAKLDDPQTLNLYSYVANNPLAQIDIDGHDGTPCKGFECQMQQNWIAQHQIGNLNNQQVSDAGLVRTSGGNGDPTLPTAVQQPAPSLAEQALKPSLSTAFMVATDGLGEIAEAGGALSKAAKIESLTADAEKLYPKLAKKADQLHHVFPKYLGGAKDGELAKIPAAYHQLITNEFRALAPYGQKIQRTAEEVERILQQVYSKYPLP